MILEEYLKLNNSNIRQMHLLTNIPEATLRSLNKRDIKKWNIEYFDALADILNKTRVEVIQEVDNLQGDLIGNSDSSLIKGKFDLENRRYIGSKSKLSSWIVELILENTTGNSFFDVFAGTGIISKSMIEYCNELIINDFLYSNEVCYNAFFGESEINNRILYEIETEFQNINSEDIQENYFSENFGGKFFSNRDALLIGEIRERIENRKNISNREKSILLASLIYSADKISNTVGHYDAYRKNVKLLEEFKYNLVSPLNTTGKRIKIYREDANDLIKKIKSDIAFVDPPYNSRQYSRFYHVLENLTKWDKPELSGVAMKPKAENMSDYCRVSAPKVFDDLIKNLNCKYIVVTYNNTYNSKSSSSRNKITHSQIINSLNSVGCTKIFEKNHKFFNAGKTELKGHKEFVFITKVGEFND